MEYEDKMQFVDDFSLVLEQSGRPRIFGQILGWLMICDPPHQSFPDLMENLEISKASVSNVTRLLLEKGMIEKVRIKGERQIYFQVRRNSLSQIIENQINEILNMNKVLKSGLNLAEKENSENAERLRVAFDYNSYLAKEIPALLKKYTEQ